MLLLTDMVRLRCQVRALSFDVVMDRDEPGAVDELLGPMAVPPRPSTTEAEFSLRIRARPEDTHRSWVAEMAGHPVSTGGSFTDAVDGLLHFVTGRLVAGDDALVSIHAASVARDGRGVLIPAPSGRGKTTLCAALLRAGCAYLTDESTGLGPDGLLTGYAKPLSLKSGATTLFPDMDPSCVHDDAGRPAVVHVPAQRLGARVEQSAPLAMIAFPEYRAGCGVELSTITTAEAAVGVLANAQNLERIGPTLALTIAANAAAGSSCSRVRYGDARHAAAALVEHMDAHASPNRSWHLAASKSTADVPCAASPGVTTAFFEDGAALVRRGSWQMLATDAIGAAVWARLCELPRQRALQVLAEEFAVPVARITADLQPWLAELTARGFVRSESEPTP